ncbi:MAG: efflux transporter periplasmic adaptor subunit [Tardiphaga sp.]|nr:efflux transporter periplasmic adaptor subunit [Tardiphaga sp.]
MSKTKTLVTSIVLFGMAAGGYAWHVRPQGNNPSTNSSQPTKDATAPTPVTSATVRSADFPIYLNSLGTVQGLNTVVVRTRVDGQVDKITFTEGQLVHEGDILAQIDPRPFQAVVDQANAKRAQDAANLANANLDLQRYTKLGDFATRQQTDTQRSTVAQITAQIAADEAAIFNAKTQLDYATVRAPITGIAGLRQVDKGNIVNSSTQTGIVTISQIEPIAVVFTAPEAQLSEINEAARLSKLKVTALTSDGRKTLAEGSLAVVNNQVDTSSGTVRLKAVFDNKDHTLWPGLSITTRLLITTLNNATVVPDDVVQHGVDGLYAFVVAADNKAEQRKIKAGRSIDGQTIVEDGLQPGERVIQSGQYKVKPGTIVSATVAQSEPAAATSAK